VTHWSQRKTAVAQEGEAHSRVAADAVESLVGVVGGFFDGVGARVGEFARLEVYPDEFDGVELVTVCGQSLDDEPVSLGDEPGFHHCRTMRRQPVPDQGDLVAAQVRVQTLGNSMSDPSL
jgi:hypothetical protein